MKRATLSHLTCILSLAILTDAVRAERVFHGRPLSSWAELIHDPNPQFRREAAFALGQCGPESRSSIPALVAALDDQDEWVRQLARDTLAGMGEPAVEPLTKALDAAATNQREGAALALARIGPPARGAVTALTERLKDGETRVQVAAAEALLKIDGKAGTVVPALTKTLDSTAPAVRLQALRLLADIGPSAKPAAARLKELALRKPDPTVREQRAERTWAAVALARSGTEPTTALPVLIDSLDFRSSRWLHSAADLVTDDERQHRAVVAALVAMGQDTVGPLVEGLARKEENVRAGAAQALSQFASLPESATAALGKVMTDPSPDVRRWAAVALSRRKGEISAEVIATLIGGLKEWPGIHTAGHSQDSYFDWHGVVVPVLVRLGPRAVPALIEAVNGEDEQTSAGAAEVLGLMGSAAKKAVPALAKRLTTRQAVGHLAVGHFTPQVSHWYGVALVRIGEEVPSAVPKLIEAIRYLAPLRRLRDYDHERDSIYEVRHAEAALDALVTIGPPAVKPLLESLATADDPTSDAQAGIAETLARISQKHLHEGIVTALGHEQPRVRAGAARALGMIGKPSADALPALKGKLTDSDALVRVRAAEAITRIDPKAEGTVAVLIEAAKGKDAGVRTLALEALGEMGPAAKEALPVLRAQLKDDMGAALVAFYRIVPNAVPALMELLAGPDAVLRNRAIEALGSFGPGAVPALVDAVNGKDEAVRLGATEALLRLGPQAKAAAPVLRQTLKDTDANLRTAAAIALWRVERAAATVVPVLSDSLNAKEVTVRVRAAQVLGEIGPAAGDAVAALEKALGDKAVDVRATSAASLGSIGEPASKALGSLVEASRDREPAVRVSAVTSLGRLSAVKTNAEKAHAALLLAIKDDDAGVRRAAVSALGMVGLEPKLVVPSILGVLKDSDRGVRERAVETLGRKPFAREAKATVPVLIELLVENGEVNEPVQGALSELGAEIVPLLIPALGHKDKLVRAEIAWLIGDAVEEPGEAVTALADRLTDPEPTVRVAVLRALGRIGMSAKAAAPAVRKALGDKDDMVRRVAATVLQRIER